MSIENIEMNSKKKSLHEDVNKLVDKYLKIMDWDIPDINEAKARQLILDEIKLVISGLEKQ
jgi:hypothetical protein